MKLPEPKSIWRDGTETQFRVVLLADNDLTVIHQSIDGKIWTCPLHLWHELMTEVLETSGVNSSPVV